MNAIDALVANILTTADARSPFPVGQVTDVGEGSAADGNALVTVRWNGTQIRVMHDYRLPPPEVGDVVLMARTQPMTILVCLAGTPPIS